VNEMHSSGRPNRTAAAVKALLACVTLLCAAFAIAQGGAMSPYQDEKDGVSAGGKWMQFQSEDKMTAAHKVRFELVAKQLLSRRSQLPASSRSVLREWQTEVGRLQSRRSASSPQSSRFLGPASTGSRGPHRRLSRLPRLELGARPLPFDGQRHRPRSSRRANV